MSEPIDWGVTIYAWSQGNFSYYDLLGFLPLVNSQLARKTGQGFEAIAKVFRRSSNVLDDSSSLIKGVTSGIEESSSCFKNASNVTEGVGKAGGKIESLTKDIKDWVGDGAKMIKNKSGDTVILSKDGTKRVRFDINNPSPHNNPHGHVEELVNGKWQKSGPIYPNDVPQN